MEVRLATLDDLPKLVQNTVAVARETEETDLDPRAVENGIRQGMAEGHGQWFITHDGAGSCMVTREWSDWRCGWYWWLQSVYVEPAARRNGVWRALFDAVHRSATEQRALGVRLLVRKENKAAIEAYTATGFASMPYRALDIIA